jgi:hypothetical protein
MDMTERAFASGVQPEDAQRWRKGTESLVAGAGSWVQVAVSRAETARRHQRMAGCADLHAQGAPDIQRNLLSQVVKPQRFHWHRVPVIVE